MSLKQAKSIFLHAVEQVAPSEWPRYLSEACGDDSSLRHGVDLLLAAHQENMDLAEQVRRAFGDALPTVDRCCLEKPGTQIGPYKLLQQIGEGGFGVVFLADQLDPVRRQVAIKVIKPGMDTRQVIARFEAERQVLAVMDHPNIARVLDAGATESGRPYFVMELVRGVPITDYCDANNLSVSDRLELFTTICQAIQHAHQKGIIHRDIKPTNVLVAHCDGVPMPKVIDFGIAKATAQKLIEKTKFTGLGQLIGTLEYMSPEQAQFNQLDIDTRSDVYSLGVLLYELLAGSTPFEQSRRNTAAFDETLRIIREVEPPKPSTRLSTASTLPTIAANRNVAPTQLRRQVTGDLDWIVMKALEKDRNRRYETAGDFAADLQRYLTDEPVHAYPPSAGYRLRKFLRRNRGPVVAASLVLLALAGGIVGTSVGLVEAEQARQAEAKRAAGERVAKETAEKRLVQIEKGMDILSSIFENLDPREEEKDSRALRVILGDRLDQAAAQLEGEAVGDALVVARLQDRLGRTYLGLGHAAEAESLFIKALATRKTELGARHPDTLSSMHNQALAYQAAGKLLQAVERFEEVRDAQVKELGADHLDTLATRNNLGVAYRLAKRPAEAVAVLAQVGDARAKQLGAHHPDTLTTLNNLALAYRADGKPAESIVLYLQVRDARVQQLGPEHPDTLTTLHHLAMAYRHVDQLPEAIALHEQVRDARVKRLGPEHPHTLTALNNLAGTYLFARKATEAIALYEQVRQARMQKLEADHQDAFITLSDLAGAYALAGNLKQALPLYHQAALSIEKRKFVHPNAGRIVCDLSECHEQLKQYDQAELWRRKWLAVVEDKAGPESVAYAVELSALASNLLKQQKYADAEPLLLKSYEGMKKREANIVTEDRDLPPPEALKWLVQLYDAWDKPEEAAKWRAALETRMQESGAKQETQTKLTPDS